MLKKLVVDDIEEDGSGTSFHYPDFLAYLSPMLLQRDKKLTERGFDDPDWNSSRCSSEPGGSLGDISMQTAGELHDVDMP